MKMIATISEVNSEQLSDIVLLENTVCLFRNLSGDDFSILLEHVYVRKRRVRKLVYDYLAYALMDAVVDYFSAIEKSVIKLKKLKKKLFLIQIKKSLLELYHLKREMIYLRKQVWPMQRYD